MGARKKSQRAGVGQRRVAASPQSGAGNAARRPPAMGRVTGRVARARAGQAEAVRRNLRQVSETDIKVPEVQRTYFEVVPTGEVEGSLEDKKLRLTRRILFLSRRWRNDMDEALRATGASH